MSCMIENSTKELSVCFTTETAFYRFGPVGETPELELVEPVETLNYTPWPGVGRSIWESVQFHNAEYSYEVAAGFERPWGEEVYEDVPERNFGGVVVRRNGKELTDLSCDRRSVDFTWTEDLSDAKRLWGYNWDTHNRVWVALPD